ncbi:MAG: hypothetical protein ACXVB9_02725 [Bdellovibrionota bacterium]
MLFRPYIALLALLPALAQAGGKACDSLTVPLKGTTAPITSHMSKVNNRINQICEKIPQLDSQAAMLGKDCAGQSETSPTNKNLGILGTAGMSGDSGVSVDGHVSNFTNRTQQLCKNIKDASKSIIDDKESFCSYYAGQTARAEAIMKAKDDASKTTDPNAQAQIFANLKKKLSEIAAEYKKVSSKAGEYVKSIERALPGTSDPKSARTDDQGLHQLLDFMSRDTAARLADIDKQSANLQKVFNAEDDAHKNTDRPSADALMAKLGASKQACTQLQGFMKKYVDVMENNLLPNGRNMTKLLDAAAKDSDAKAADSEKEAAKSGAKEGTLGAVSDGKPDSTKPSTITGKTPTPGTSAPSDKPAPVAADIKDQPKPGLAEPSAAKELAHATATYHSPGDSPLGPDELPQATKPSAPAPAPAAESADEQKLRAVYAAAGIDKDADGWLPKATTPAPVAPAPAAASTDDPYAPPGSAAAAAKAGTATRSGEEVTQDVLNASKADTAREAQAAATSRMAKDLGIDDIKVTPSPLVQQQASLFGVTTPGANPALAQFTQPGGASWAAPAPTQGNSILTPWDSNAPKTNWFAPDGKVSATPSSPIFADSPSKPSYSIGWGGPKVEPDATPAAPAPVASAPAPVAVAPATEVKDTGLLAQVDAESAPSRVSPAVNAPAPASVAPADVPYSQGGMTGSHTSSMVVPDTSADKNAAIANAGYWDRWPGTMTSWEGYSPTSKSFSNTANGSTTWYQEWCKGSTCYYRAK